MAVGCFLLPVVTLILVLRFVSQRGIRPPRRAPGGATLSIPTAGHARILARKVDEKPDRVEWQWTVVGDRNWTTARESDDGFILGGAYPFNSRSTLGGTHIWTLDLTVSSRSARPGYVEIQTSLEGTTGMRVSQTRTAAASRVASAASISLVGDTLVSVPSRVRLAEVAGRVFTIQIQR